MLGVRDTSNDLRKSGAPSKIDVLQLDMNSFASVAAFTDLVSKSYKQIDIVVLNAGLYNLQYSTSPSGWEEILQVSTLFTTLLALLLLPVLRATKRRHFINPPPRPRLLRPARHRLPHRPALTTLTHPLILQGPSNPYPPLQRNPAIRELKAPLHVRPKPPRSPRSPRPLLRWRAPSHSHVMLSWFLRFLVGKVGSVVPNVGHVGFLQGIWENYRGGEWDAC